MKGYQTVPPPQKFMTVKEIFLTYGPRGVVAYSCKVSNSVLVGGCVIAVQTTPGADTTMMKMYMSQLKQRYPDKAPIYYLRVAEERTRGGLILTYDSGVGEKTIAPKLQ